MSKFLASLPTQPAAGVPTVAVSYGAPRESNTETQYVLKKRVHKNFRTALSDTEKDLAELLGWSEGWNGYDAAEPNSASIDHACRWVRAFYRDVRDVLWIKPLITADEEGDVVFEWWKGRRKLTVYVSPDTLEYIKVDRARSPSEMGEGSITTSREGRALWHWLLSS